MTSTATILWFRQDLRLSDNPALLEAVAKGDPIIPLYIQSENQEGWSMGGAQRWWLHYSLEELDQSLKKMGAKLILRRGQPQQVLTELIDETQADAVFWNRCYEPFAIKRDTAIKEKLKKDGIQVESFNASLLYEPWEVQNKSGKPFQVFTFFWKAALALRDPLPPKTVKAMPSPKKFPQSATLESFHLLPTIDWAKTIRKMWKPGEAGAQARLKEFLKTAVFDYLEGRDRPDFEGVSRLSPYLHFGEIGPRQCWQAVRCRQHNESKPRRMLKSICANWAGASLATI
jgi:deoxyribodipyrimidine photo-lyase